MGGAQAIFALAYGTETIVAVDVIAGPGNAWVREAKRAVYGTVGDRLARRPLGADGVAGHDTDPEWAALDLCAQAEHGRESPLWSRSPSRRPCSTRSAEATEARRGEPRRRRRRAAGAGPGSRPRATRSTSPTPSRPSTSSCCEDDGGRCSPSGSRTRRLRLRRPLRRDRLRRLRRRLQPRPADRRRRALLGPARAGRLPPQDRDRGGPGRARRRSLLRTSTRSPAPRASPSTASQR